MRLLAPTCTATLSTGLGFAVQSAGVTLDVGQAPYIQAGLVCALPDAAALEHIDPRARQRLAVTLDDNADVFGGVATSRTMSLLLTGRSRDAGTGLLTLTAMSDEAVLIRRGLTARSSKAWPATTVQRLVQLVLASLGYGCTFSGTDYSIDPAAATQAPGQSYWDFLDGTLQAGNLRLWADEAGAFHLDDKATIRPGQLSLEWGVDITELADSIDITTGDYFDSLVVRYSYLDAAGNPETSYDYATSSAIPVATGLIDFPTAPGIAGAAKRLLRRMQGRGRVLTPSAVSRFDVIPGQSYAVTLPDGAPTQTGLVESVSWQHPATTMTVVSRELSDTVPTMWGAQPAGVSWASIAPGTSWLKYLAIAWSSVPVGETWDSESAGLRWQEYGE